jgi:hypothetical protein
LADAEVGRIGEEGGYGEKDMDVDGGGLGTVDTREEILAEVVLVQVKEVGKQVSVLPEGGDGPRAEDGEGGRKPSLFCHLQWTPSDNGGRKQEEFEKKRRRGLETEEELLDHKRKRLGELGVLNEEEKAGLEELPYQAK